MRFRFIGFRVASTPCTLNSMSSEDFNEAQLSSNYSN